MGVVRPSFPEPRARNPGRILGLMDEHTASAGSDRASASHGIPILGRLTKTSPNLRVAGYVIAVAGTAIVTLVFLPIRDDITRSARGSRTSPSW